MVTYALLNACADDQELFYARFAEVNYGGQVFDGARYKDAEPGGTNWGG